MKHISNYDTGKYYNKKPLNKHNSYHFYNGTLNFRKNAILSNSQQTGIRNNLKETNTQITNYIGDDCLNNDKIATVILNPTQPLNTKTIHGFLKQAITSFLY